jgi:hypothetical protein
MALAKKQIDKVQLEQICAQYLRPKGHRVERVTIARSPNGIVGQLAGVADRFRRKPAGGNGGNGEEGVIGDEVTQEVDRLVAPVG